MLVCCHDLTLGELRGLASEELGPCTLYLISACSETGHIGLTRIAEVDSHNIAGSRP